MKKLLLVLAVVGMAGCSTSPVTAEKAKAVPKDRILLESQGNSTIIITRDNGWFAGGGCFVSALIDGKPFARIGTGETTSIKVQDGRHILAITGDKDGKGLCGFQIGQPIKENSTEIKPNEIQKFRITGDTSSGLDLRPTSI